ncbi:MAG: hypothetical protein WCL11_14945, partial [Verrucomicrobiota bacterium]
MRPKTQDRPLTAFVRRSAAERGGATPGTKENRKMKRYLFSLVSSLALSLSVGEAAAATTYT